MRGMRAATLSWTIRRFGEIGSTMDAARSLAEQGAPHGTVVLAESQRTGRGRSGRSWISPPGNLHTTLILRPECDARRSPEIGFVIAVALAQAVDELAGPGTALKWPNDVLRGGAKLAGILLERLDDGAILAGVGANLRSAPADMPYPVTSLSEQGCDAGPESLLDALLRRAEVGWSAWRKLGFAHVLADWARFGPPVGSELKVRLNERVSAGRFAGLSDDGSLLLDGPEGRQRFVAGEVLLPDKAISHGA